MASSSSFTWDDVRNQVRRLRTQTQASFSNHNIWTCKNFCFHSDQHKVYFLSNCIPPNQTSSRQFILYQADFSMLYSKKPDTCRTLSLKWSRVFNEHESPVYYGSQQGNRTCHERTRPLQTLSSFQMINDTLLMTSMGNIYTGALGQIPKFVSSQHLKMNAPQSTSEFKLPDTSNRSDPKLGGTRNDLFAFIRNRDIWVSDFTGVEVQLTFCFDRPNTSLSCGVAEYVMQEEFHRRTGYYWRPSTSSTSSNSNQILYLETNEENVELIQFSKQNDKSHITTTTTAVDYITLPASARYPRAGCPNATSQLHLLEFTNEISPLRLTNLHHKRLRDRNTIDFLYPWAEYIVRFDWLPDGESVWAQILSRDQTKTVVIRIPCTLFKTDDEYTFQKKTDTAKVDELWSETQETWVNVSDAYYFLHNDEANTVDGRQPSCTTFIWSSELTGYRHLYHVTKQNDNDEAATIQQLTHGEWCVVDKPLYVDQRRKLVYFMAKMDTPLETHLYVTTYDHQKQSHPIRRLTSLGYSHSIEMNNTMDVFVDLASCLRQPNGVVIRRLQYTDDDPLPTTNDRYSHGHENSDNDSDKDNIAILMSAMKDIDDIKDFDVDMHFHDMVIAHPTLSIPGDICCSTSTKSVSRNPSLSTSTIPFDQHLNGNFDFSTTTCQNTIDKYDQRTRAIPEGQIFDFMTSDGIKLYGCLYKPRLYRPGKSYPTILQIYGGPKTQMVTNEFKFPRLLRYLMAVYFGFAVVVIDGRGSCDRGLAFESYVKGRLGMVEIQDQLEGLHYLATSRFGAMPKNNNRQGQLVSVVDLDRVAVTGWSYGGYLSLMGLARYNDIFKISIAGAPVTKWELYDSAYTERYMGMPSDRPESYRESSILHWVDKFPDTENRLIIVHGLIDENVHFTNSELLVSQLVNHHKPYHLQVYPTEKHGLRHSSVNEHFDILMFHCLLNNL
ncbi:unnamed protein product [Absidia cylindrospora]